MGDEDCEKLLGLGLSIGIGEHYNGIPPPPPPDLVPVALLHHQDSSSSTPTLLLSENPSCKQFSFAQPDYFDLDILIHRKLRYSYVAADEKSTTSREGIVDINQSPLVSYTNELHHRNREMHNFLISNEEEEEEEEEEEGQGCIQKPNRLSTEQLTRMEEFYKENNTTNIKNTEALAKQLNLSPRRVNVWFKKRRARESIIDIEKSPAASYHSNERQHDDCEVKNVVVSNKEEEPARKKLKLSEEQSACMEQCFKHGINLNIKQKQALAKQLNLSIQQIGVWFQNRRARSKNKQIETDCEMWKRCSKWLMDENKRLQKELSQLKALKQAGIAVSLEAPLIVCPSCQSSLTSPNTTHSIPSHLPKQRWFPPKNSEASYC